MSTFKISAFFSGLTYSVSKALVLASVKELLLHRYLENNA
jgi:hypothetical protein